jgi:hypothetical protein
MTPTPPRASDEDVEAIARAICVSDGEAPDAVWKWGGGTSMTRIPFWIKYTDHARAAIAAMPRHAPATDAELAREMAEDDARILGIGFMRKHPDGRTEYIPPEQITIHGNTIHTAPPQSYEDGLEAAAKIADAHKGQAARDRIKRRLPLSDVSPEAAEEIRAEERGEDIASEIIAKNIRTLKDKTE